MEQPPKITAILRGLWLQQFRERPVATLCTAIVGIAAIAGLLFLSVFLTVGLVAAGAVFLLYQKLLGRPIETRLKRRYEADQNRNSQLRQRDVIEGDYRDVTGEDSPPRE